MGAAVTAYPPDRRAITARVRDALESLPTSGGEAARLRVFMLVGRLVTFVDDPALLERAIGEGLAITADRPNDADRARLLTLSAVIAHHGGDAAGAAGLAAEVLDRSRSTADDRARMRAALVLQGIPRRLHPSDTQLPDPEEILALARRVGDAQDLHAARATLASSQLRRGDIRASAATTAEILEEASVAGNIAAEALAITVLAGIAAWRGDHETAVRFDVILDAAGGTFDATIPPSLLSGYLAMMQRSRDTLGPAGAARAEETAMRWGWSDAVASATEYCLAVASAPKPASAPQRAHRLATGGVAAKRTAALTGRQVEVLELLAQGATNKTIAAMLGVRPKTVMHHNEAIFRKLGVRGRAAAVSAAHRLGLIATRGSERLSP